MDESTPTHFDAILCGTGLVESILAAALAKAGYDVLQLDEATYYGSRHAALSLDTYLDLLARPPAYISRVHTSSAGSNDGQLPREMLDRSARFCISPCGPPALLCAQGQAIDVLVRSRVASYLHFGLLAGIATPASSHTTAASEVQFERVPASKADVFNNSQLSLVEKRRLSKLLLLAAGSEPLAPSAEPHEDVLAMLQKGFNLSASSSRALAHSLCLCTSPSDVALPALERLRRLIRATGRFGPSPLLLAHYGGPGDLIGGYSRLCAVWGGGQIIGRPLGRLEREATPRRPASRPAPAAGEHTQGEQQQQHQRERDLPGKALGVPVHLDDDGDPTLFTANWVISSRELLPRLLPSLGHSATRRRRDTEAKTRRIANAVLILSRRLAFPPRISRRRADNNIASGSAAAAAAAAAAGEDDEGREQEQEEQEADLAADTTLFVFPPSSSSPATASTTDSGGAGCGSSLGTVTAMQVGDGTNACPSEFTLLYVSAPVLSPLSDAEADDDTSKKEEEGRGGAGSEDAYALLRPYVEQLNVQAATPLHAAYYFVDSPPAPDNHNDDDDDDEEGQEWPERLLCTPRLDSEGLTSALAESLDDATRVAEELFWRVVRGRGCDSHDDEDGVEFFAKEHSGGADDEE